MARYGEKASEKVERALYEHKEGKLKSGTSDKKVTSRKQAIAIGLSQARKEGAKVPAAPVKKLAKKPASRKTVSTKKAARKRASSAR